MTLVDFLTARLDEDEAAARAAGAAGGASSWHTLPHPMYEGRVEDENGLTVVYNEGAPTGDEAAHIARHDPARVLREVAAKRAILAKAIEWEGDPNDYGQYRHACALLAAVYSDHADYREEWRP